MAQANSTYIPEWCKGQDICIIMDDKTGVDRSQEYLDDMMNEMRDVANKFGFDFRSWDHPEAVAKGVMKVVAIQEEDFKKEIPKAIADLAFILRKSTDDQHAHAELTNIIETMKEYER